MRLWLAAAFVTPIANIARSATWPSSLLAACALTGLTFNAPTALANETWATDMINQIMAARAEEAGGHARRASPVERVADIDADDDEMRPQRKTVRSRDSAHHPRRAVRVASLGREIAPHSAVAPSIAREPPHQQGTGPGPMIAGLGRDLAQLMGSLRLGTLPPRPDTPRKLGPMVASLGREFVAPAPSAQPPLSGGRIAWVASAACLASPLRAVLTQIAANFGPVRVNSTCRSRRHNARVGGARRSYHLTGNAADFRVAGGVKEVYAFLRASRSVGGLKHYGFGLFHIDTGPRRTW
jgi:hypothetical protein